MRTELVTTLKRQATELLSELERNREPILITQLTLAGGCSNCENEAFQIVKSPSGRMTAFVFNRGCGATVGLNTQLSVVRGSFLPKDGGNAPIMDGTVPLSVSWLSDTSLQVAGPLRTQAFKKETSVEGVRITYVQ